MNHLQHIDHPAPGEFALHHVGIVTSLDQYDGVVSLLVSSVRAEVEDVGDDEELDINATWLRLPSGLRIEVVAPRGNVEGPVAKFLEKTGGGLHHLSFDTEAIDACKAFVKSGGARIVGERANHSGWAEFFIDPAQTGGALLHWMQAVE